MVFQKTTQYQTKISARSLLVAFWSQKNSPPDWRATVLRFLAVALAVQVALVAPVALIALAVQVALVVQVVPAGPSDCASRVIAPAVQTVPAVARRACSARVIMPGLL